jgi:hypothetical protein
MPTVPIFRRVLLLVALTLAMIAYCVCRRRRVNGRMRYTPRFAPVAMASSCKASSAQLSWRSACVIRSPKSSRSRNKVKAETDPSPCLPGLAPPMKRGCSLAGWQLAHSWREMRCIDEGQADITGNIDIRS